MNSFFGYQAASLFLLIVLSFAIYQPIKAQERTANDRIIILDPAEYDPENQENSLFKPQPLGNIKKTAYEKFEREDGSIAIEARSERSASGLVVPLDLDPAEFRYIQWEWKIDEVLQKGDLTKKDGDDYAARIYITFDYDKSNLGFRDRTRYFFIRTFTSFDVPLRAINYIWANKADKGTVAPSPYTDWVRLIAVQSGNENAGKWVVEKQDILEDYRNAFGEDPPRISGISIMTDSDDTKSSSAGYYGKIVISKDESTSFEEATQRVAE